MQNIRILSLVFILSFFQSASFASDHADPFKIGPDEQAANITGLFFFPEVCYYDKRLLVIRARWNHPFPSRTRK